MRARYESFTRPLVGVLTLLAAALAVALAAGSALAQDPYAPYAPYVPPTKAAPDKTGPRMTKVTLTPKVARRGARLTIGFKLDEAARVAGEVTLRTRGVRTKGGRCVKRTRARRGAGCTRRTRAGTLLAARAGVGENRGRIDLGALRVGEYTLTLTPTDASGNVGVKKLIAFRVRR
jgi:hypothetical protein